MEEARLLDGQDRFLNGKAAKYWLRAGNVAKAEELLVMFTKVLLTPLRSEGSADDRRKTWLLRLI